MDLLVQINDAVNNFVWGAPMLILLVGVGILMTLRTKGVQFRHFGHVMKNTVGKIFTKQEAGDGEMTPFQALTTALGSTVGTGNIAGVTSAITRRAVLAVGHRPHRHVHQVFRSAAGGEIS
jgi:AGCS family alanine or glycine:cation symporter